MPTQRSRALYLLLILLVIIAGLCSRRYDKWLPSFFASYAGDSLWALMVFLGFGLLFPTASILRNVALALIFSLCIELSQIYQANWIQTIRQNSLGGLILGFGFLWSDLICYTVGISFGGLLEWYYFKVK